MILSNLNEEKKLRKCGFRVLAGVDEAGRGSLAGPVVAAACCVPDFDVFLRSARAKEIVRLVDDSKILTAAERERAFEAIKNSNFFEISVAKVGAREIDRINVRNAAIIAMTKAVNRLHKRPDAVLVDGIDGIPIGIRQYTYIRGDNRVFLIAAASIIAKVSRDREMVLLAKRYGGYGFEKHKGYGTSLHAAKIRKSGLSPVHRKSFCLKIVQFKNLTKPRKASLESPRSA